MASEKPKPTPRISPLADLSDVPPEKIRQKMKDYAFVGKQQEWELLPPELMPNPRGEHFIVTVGVSYIFGSLTGLVAGAAEGFIKGRKLPGLRLKLNSIVNAMGTRGSKAGNAIASLALLYSGTSWFLNYAELPPQNEYFKNTEVMRSATSAAAAGALYRLPMGFGPSLTFATVGALTMAGATYAKQQYHPAPFNPSIKDLWDSVTKKDQLEALYGNAASTAKPSTSSH